MTTAEAPVVVDVRCPWCGALLAEIENARGAKVRMRCHGRKCGQWVERTV